MPGRDGSNNGSQTLAYWLLGALLAAVLATSGWAHTAIMSQLDSIERRIERLESTSLASHPPTARP